MAVEKIVNKRLNLLIIGVVMALALAIMPTSMAASSADPPDQVHLSWSTNDVYHTMTVMWWTKHENSGNYVVYDTEHCDSPENYDFSTEGKAFQIDPEEGVNGRKVKVDWDGWYHETELTGLEPGTTYYFRVGGAGGWSREWKFRTIGFQENIKFVIGGDSRRQWENWPKMRNVITSRASAEDPDFIVFNGDMVWRGAGQSPWDKWFNCFEDRLVNDGRMIPIVPIIGNHEIYSPAVSPASTYAWFKGVFANPGNELWYSLDFPKLHIVSLCTTDEAWTAEEEAVMQENWLREDLTQSDAEWKIAVFHIPWYSTSYSSWPPVSWGATAYMNHWAPILENTKHGVDLVANGHHHNYERFYPLLTDVENQRAIVSMKWAHEEVVDNSWGIDYFVQGGWGAPLSGFGRAEERTITKAKKCSYTLIEVGGGKMHLTTKDALGETFDQKRWVLPEQFEYENLSIESKVVKPGENVAISVNVRNTGGVKGTKIVKLAINGKVKDSENVILSPGESRTVPFKVSRDEAGTYEVSIENLTGSFEIAKPSAKFEFSNLSVSKPTVEPGESFTVSVLVTNTGNASGSYTAEVSISSETKTKEVTLDPGASKNVTFDITENEAGTYEVSAGGMTESFEVVKPEGGGPEGEGPEGGGVPALPVIAGVIAAISVVGAWIWRRRRV